MRRIFIISVMISVPVVAILGVFIFIKVAYTGVLYELEVNPGLRVTFYWIDNWDLHYDMYYKVYRNGQKIFTSEVFFYALGDSMEPTFHYHKLDERYVAIYDNRAPKRFIIIMDLQEGIYGKNTLTGPSNVHAEFNRKMFAILDLFKQSLHDNTLFLDEFHYNFQRR